MLERIINIPLITHPLNWGIVLVTLMISGYALSLIAEANGGGCACKSDNV